MKGLLSEEEELRRFNAAQGGEQPWYAKALPMEGRATILPFRDTMPGSVFNKREFALPGLLAEAVNAFTSPARALLGTDADFYPEKEAANMALNLFGGGITTGKALRNPTGVGGTDLALNAYHGTPHEIKGGFDISKVGTGEGAQAYGHGMYFAESPAVAQQYQRDISRSQLMKGGDPQVLDQTINGKPLVSIYENLSNKADRMPYEKAAIEYEKMSFLEDLMQGTQFKDALTRIDDPAVVKWAQTLESGYKPAGNLYKADIPDAAIPMMLDWDKPLSQQPKEIQTWLSDPYNPYKKQLLQKDSGGNEPYGRDIYNRLANLMSEGKGWDVGNKNASQELSSFGITGIRYLDEGSRGTGKGTSNYVVFDPSTVKILEKNDIKIEDLIEKGLLGD